MAFLEKAVELGVTDTELYQCPALMSGSAHGLVFSNVSGSSQTIVLKLYSQTTGLAVTVTGSGQQVAANSQFTWPKPINMQAGDRIIASCGTGASVVAVVSIFIDTSSTLVTGVTPLGEWVSTTTYQPASIVSYNATSYMAMNTNVNSAPPSANWMRLSAGLTFTVGTITTGAPDTLASVTNVGTPNDVILNMNIPRGDPSIPRRVSLTMTGTVAPAIGTARWYAPAAITFTSVVLYLGTVASTSVVVAIRKNGFVISPSTFTISASSYKSSATSISLALAVDDYLTVDVVSGSDGADLVVGLIY